MALNDNRVWDYHGDYFVHRLIQNESSRKIIGPGRNSEYFFCEIEKIREKSHFIRIRNER